MVDFLEQNLLLKTKDELQTKYKNPSMYNCLLLLYFIPSSFYSLIHMLCWRLVNKKWKIVIIMSQSSWILSLEGKQVLSQILWGPWSNGIRLISRLGFDSQHTLGIPNCVITFTSINVWLVDFCRTSDHIPPCHLFWLYSVAVW